ncbi:Nn.00g094750.m01.CDS01 [Neocucurbitaria sp. VM-36]
MFKVTRAMAMQPTRMMMMRPSPQLFMRQTMRMRTPMPKEEHGAHTVSQRLRQLKNIPTEIWPLIVVLGVAVGAAFFSLGRKLVVDRTLRLKRQGKLE